MLPFLSTVRVRPKIPVIWFQDSGGNGNFSGPSNPGKWKMKNCSMGRTKRFVRPRECSGQRVRSAAPSSEKHLCPSQKINPGMKPSLEHFYHFLEFPYRNEARQQAFQQGDLMGEQGKERTWNGDTSRLSEKAGDTAPHSPHASQ